MEIKGTHQFKAPIEAVWNALLDPTVLATALPGGDQLERIGENDYKAAMNVKVGPVQGRFEGKVTLTNVEPQKGYHMKVSGTGGPGFLNGEGDLTLASNDAGTLLTYAGDVQVGGRIASVGQRLIDSTAKSIIRQGFKALDEQLSKGPESSPAVSESSADKATSIPTTTATSDAEIPPTTSPTVASNGAPAPSRPVEPVSHAAESPSPAFGKMAVEVAKEIAQDLASDYIPREKQPHVVAFIAGALAMLLFIMLVRSVQRD